MGKARKGRPKGAKNKKAQSWATQFEALSGRNDIGTIERWAMKIGVERIDAANGMRRDVFSMLAIRSRELDVGGRVVAEGAVDEHEHLALDPLRRAGILDDPKEPMRALWRLEAGVELLRLWVEGRVQSRSTAPWRAVGGGGGGGITAEEADGKIARDEMRYLRALDAVGEHQDLIRAVCCDMAVPAGAKRSTLLTALDLLAEYLHGIDPPAGTVRPKLRIRDRVRPGGAA